MDPSRPPRPGCEAQPSSFAFAAANSSSVRTPAVCSSPSCLSCSMSTPADGAGAWGAGCWAAAPSWYAASYSACCWAAWPAYFCSWWCRTAPAVPAITAVVAAARISGRPLRRIIMACLLVVFGWPSGRDRDLGGMLLELGSHLFEHFRRDHRAADEGAIGGLECFLDRDGPVVLEQ